MDGMIGGVSLGDLPGEAKLKTRKTQQHCLLNTMTSFHPKKHVAVAEQRPSSVCNPLVYLLTSTKNAGQVVLTIYLVEVPRVAGDLWSKAAAGACVKCCYGVRVRTRGPFVAVSQQLPAG